MQSVQGVGCWGRLQSGGNKGLLGCHHQRVVYLSVCVHTYICLYVSSHERVIEKLDCNFVTQLEVSKIFMDVHQSLRVNKLSGLFWKLKHGWLLF